VLRAVPCVEAAAALAVYDALLERRKRPPASALYSCILSFFAAFEERVVDGEGGSGLHARNGA